MERRVWFEIHRYISTSRYVSCVKNEIMQSAIEFLQQQLNCEQKSIFSRLKSFLKAFLILGIVIANDSLIGNWIHLNWKSKSEGIIPIYIILYHEYQLLVFVV